MFSLGNHFIGIVVLTLTITSKAKLEIFPFCKNVTTKIYASSLICYNYTILPTDIQNPQEVKELTIASQYLEKLKSGEFHATNLINLEDLYLEENAIKTIEMGAFFGVKLLQWLSLENNEIEEIDLRVFKDLPNLWSLKLDGNPLKGFASDAEFPPLNITYLTLCSGKITSIPTNMFRNLEKLEMLWLDNNQLQVLDWKVFLPLKSLKQVYLEGKPFHCDCQVKFLLDFLDMKNVTWHYFPYPSCQSSSTPSNKKLIGIELKEIDRKLLVCPPKINSIHLSKPSNNQTLNGNKMGMVSIECEYEGYPEPNVTWIRNGRLVSFEDDVIIETKRDDDTFPQFNYKFKQILTIPSSRAFYGSYKCQAAPNRFATLHVDDRISPAEAVTPTIFSSTKFNSIWTTKGTTPSSKTIYQSRTSTDVNRFSTATFESVSKTIPSATLNLEASTFLADAITPTISASTEFKNKWIAAETTPSIKNIYKSLTLAPSSTDGHNLSTITFHYAPKTPQNAKNYNILQEITELHTSFRIIIVALAVIVVLLLGVILSSGIYIVVRYAKTKRKALPKNIYRTVPPASNPNNVSQSMTSEEEPPYPPLLNGLENVYEICGDGEVHFYEIPVIAPTTRPFDNQTYLRQDSFRPNKSSNQTC